MVLACERKEAVFVVLGSTIVHSIAQLPKISPITLKAAVVPVMSTPHAELKMVLSWCTVDLLFLFRSEIGIDVGILQICQGFLPGCSEILFFHEFSFDNPEIWRREKWLGQTGKILPFSMALLVGAWFPAS